MAATSKGVWAGRVISWLAGLAFVLSGVMKLVGGPEVEQGFAHLSLPASMRVPLAILEIAVALVYLIPPTAVLGAILLAGYVGGTIVSHWRLSEPVFVQIALGLLVWLGIYLRDDRLKALIPLRRA